MPIRSRPPAAAPAAYGTPAVPGGAGAQDPGTDLRLLLPALAAWLTAATAVTRPALAGTLVAACAAVLCAVLVRRRPGRGARRRGGVPLAAAALACACAGLAATATRTAARESPLAALARDRAVVTLDLAVTDDPRPLTGRVVGAQRIADALLVDARAERVTRGPTAVALRRPVLVFARGAGWSDRIPGERLRSRGRLRPPLDPGAPPAFEPFGPPQRLRAAPLPARVAGRLRAGLRDAAAVLPPDARGLLPGLVVGDTSRLDPAVREDFRRTGLTHLVAVSGQNVAILLAAVLLVARRCGVGPRTAATLGGAGLAFFVVLARPSPSVLRAATMGAFALVGTVTGRERAALRLLAGAALVLVLLDPALARSIGFALSTAATAGLLVLGPPWRARLARRLPGWLADGIAAPLAAQVACAPLLAAAFGRVSLVAIPANVLVAPAVAPATLAGFAAAALAPVAPPLARLAARLAGLPVGWLVTVARRGAAVPAGNVTVPTGLTGAVLTAVLATLAVLLLARRAGRVFAGVCAAVAVSTTAVVTYVAPAWPPPGWRLVACDVGQGDALVVRTSAGAVVVDVGPDPLAADRCLRDLRVSRVAAVVLTHFHADHVEGLPGVLRGRRVPEVVVGPLEEPPEERARVARWAGDRGVPVRLARLGERWTAGDAAFEVLGPHAAFRGTDSDPNNSSLVLRAATPGLTVLLTGDVEEPAQLALLARGAAVRADVLKVPHHGSARQTADFLAATGAAAAIVSAGAGNPYGHPAPATLSALAGRGMRTFRTDRDGDVAVSPGPDGVRVTGRRGPGTPPRDATALDRLAAQSVAFRRATDPSRWCPVRPTRRDPGPRARRAAPRPAALPPRPAALPPRPAALPPRPAAMPPRPAALPSRSAAPPARGPPRGARTATPSPPRGALRAIL